MSFRYTNVQYTEMVRTLAKCDDNVALACRTFNARYGTSVDRRTMLGATQRLRDFGTFQPNTAIDRGTNVQIPTRRQVEILDYFSENPHLSTREASSHFNVSHMYVWRTLHGDRQHPFHLRRCQELTPTDYVPRLEFSRWLLENWQRNVIWTDESTFTRVGMDNQHNTHLWMHENPHASRVASFQHRYSVNVWALSGLKQQSRKRALKCIEQGGGHFESVLKRLKKAPPERRILTWYLCKYLIA